MKSNWTFNACIWSIIKTFWTKNQFQIHSLSYFGQVLMFVRFFLFIFLLFLEKNAVFFKCSELQVEWGIFSRRVDWNERNLLPPHTLLKSWKKGWDFFKLLGCLCRLGRGSLLINKSASPRYFLRTHKVVRDYYESFWST